MSEARRIAVAEARRAKAQGASFDTFVERCPEAAALPDRERDALFHCVFSRHALIGGRRQRAALGE